jgi:hypothetical protein
MSLLLCFYTMQSHDEVGISNLRQNLLIRLINQVSCRDCRFGIHPITERVYIWDPPYVCISASERRTPPHVGRRRQQSPDAAKGRSHSTEQEYNNMSRSSLSLLRPTEQNAPSCFFLRWTFVRHPQSYGGGANAGFLGKHAVPPRL